MNGQDLCRTTTCYFPGKLDSTEPRFIVPRLARLLKRGGIASLLLVPFYAHFAFPGKSQPSLFFLLAMVFTSMHFSRFYTDK